MPSKLIKVGSTVFALVIIILGGSYAYQTFISPNSSSLKLGGTYMLAPYQIEEIFFNVTVSGHHENIYTPVGIYPTQPFALAIIAANYSHTFISTLRVNFTIGTFNNLTNNSPLYVQYSTLMQPNMSTGLASSDPGEFISAGEYVVLLINLSGSRNSVAMRNTTISY